MSNFRRKLGYIETEIGKFSKIFWKINFVQMELFQSFIASCVFHPVFTNNLISSTDKMYQLRIPNIFEVLMTLFQHCKEEQTSVGYIF